MADVKAKVEAPAVVEKAVDLESVSPERPDAPDAEVSLAERVEYLEAEAEVLYQALRLVAAHLQSAALDEALAEVYG